MDLPATTELTIERILPGGVGLAHAEGRTFFVALAAPGDVVRVRLDRLRGKLVFASIVDIIQPSLLRVEPPCPYFGACGGCDFQQLSYKGQLAAKVEMIRDCLRRIGHIDPPPEVPIMPSPKQWHYRSRANWQFDSETKRLGYFERASHRVCDVADCAVLVSGLQQTLEKVRERISELPEDLTEIEAAASGEAVSLSPAISDFLAADLKVEIADNVYHCNARSFFQVNHEILGPLIAAALASLSGKTAVDLYCGVGLFTVPLSLRFARVIGVESHGGAAEFARRNLRQAKAANAKIEEERVVDWLRSNAGSGGEFDFLLLDPPRSGAEDGAIENILKLGPLHIGYVSCDPATLARDLKPLLAGGYSLDTIAAFDMFPQTHHVETVVHLTRSRQ